ncbi:glycoside hydrolase family 5 protein [Fibrobacter sp. UWEL]|uniref:glycoside hydrolase family 5 protein n=1 Tax=Fibrobacter sp. UWEL TaxID=1896209 RepID=UPI0009241778|nr:glycoside hydrolase family 5 protein [Fibrobacter sp. UWEL]SHL18906.1 Aryl-phospho-beta-D-glucosidase BglC, GH1 family [Fibrobacter sp. UWEL]
MNYSRLLGLTAGLSLMAGVSAFAAFPKSADLVTKMGFGFNIGNSMEVPNDPTGWGNPFPTKDLMDSIKAAGFSTVRIPCAWDSHAPGGVITETWLDSVKTVVDYAIANQLYVVLNIHHEGEGGWFQTHIDETVDNTVDTKMKNYWTQIATKFAAYDEHLIFAGANEPGSNLGDKWTANHVSTLMHYYQTFINAVRAVPGNETRTLIIQGLNTDIDKSVKSAPVTVFPTDTQTGYLMFEVHYYDPYQYTLMYEEQDWGAPNNEKIIPQYFYGADFLSTTEPKRNAGYNAWAGSVDAAYYTEKHVNTQFAKMKSNYADKGYPVLIGEFGANIRTPDLDGADLEKHLKGRVQWHKDVAAAAKKYGVVPVLWDMGNESTDGYDNMAYIRRQSAPVGKIVDADAINAIREAFNMTAVIGGGTTPVIQAGDKALHVTYKTVQSDSSEAGTVRIDLGGKDWSQYVAISFDMRVAGESAGPCLDQTRDGCAEYGWASVSLFNMSGEWDWKEVSLGNVEDLGLLDNYKIAFGATGMAITDPTDMKAIGINLYGTQFTGDMYLDNMLLWKADGTADTLNNFNKKGASYGGIAKGSLIQANATGDWGVTTTPSTAIKPTATASRKMQVSIQQGLVNTTFHSPRASQASVMLLNTLGQEVAAKHFTAMPGSNSVQLSTNYRGAAVLIVKQGKVAYSKRVILK